MWHHKQACVEEQVIERLLLAILDKKNSLKNENK